MIYPRQADAHDKSTWRTEKQSKFKTTNSREIHVTRRKAIIKAHPEVLELQGPDPSMCIQVVITVAFQFLMSYYVRDHSIIALIFWSYVVSATLTHSLLFAMHEASHNNFLPVNQYFNPNIFVGYFTDTVRGIAVSVTYRRHHADHHAHLGEDLFDVDLPSAWECKVFSKNRFTKMMWVFLLPVFFCRGIVTRPKNISIHEYGNWAAVLTVNYFVATNWGMQSVAYFLLGTWFGGGLHPMAGHLIAEHFEFVPGQETYSSYGPLNWISFNGGFHNEHHDFPRVPGSKLPIIKALAPEFYDMPAYHSWWRVIFDFIMWKEMDVKCRFVRENFQDQVEEINSKVLPHRLARAFAGKGEGVRGAFLMDAEEKFIKESWQEAAFAGAPEKPSSPTTDLCLKKRPSGETSDVSSSLVSSPASSTSGGFQLCTYVVHLEVAAGRSSRCPTKLNYVERRREKSE